MLKNISLVKKIFFLTLFSLLSTLMTALISIYFLNTLNTNSNTLIEKETKKLSLSKDIELDLIKMENIENNIILLNTFENINSSLKHFKTIEKSLHTKRIQLRSLLKDKNKITIEYFNINLAHYLEVFTKIINLKREGLDQKALDLSNSTSKEFRNKALKYIIDNIHLNENSLTIARHDFNKEHQNSIIQLSSIVFLFTIAIILLTLIVHKSITKRLERINKQITFIQEGHEGQYPYEEYSALETNVDELNNISNALHETIQTLKENSISMKQTTWSNEAIIGLNNELVKAISIQEVGDRSLDFICRYLNVNVGVLYYHEEESDDEVLFLSSYAYLPVDDEKYSFKFKEGTIGEVASSQCTIVHNSESSLIIENASSSHTPNFTITLPLMYQERLYGVIELASDIPFERVTQKLLNSACIVMGSALATAVQNEKVEKLLIDAQSLNKQMSKQQKSLKDQQTALDAHSIVGITDVKGTITYANSKFVEVSGYSEQELLGANHRILNSGDYDEAFWKEMYSTISSGKIWHYPAIHNKAKNGSDYWVDTTIFPFMNSKGKPESYIAIRTDVTKTKEDEQELLIAKEKAEYAVEAKAAFLASMSHEIRTPMNGIIGMLDLLRNTNLTQQQDHKAMLAQSSAQSLLSVINDILDFSKLEAGKVELESIEFDLREELGNFAEAIAVNLKDSQVEIILELTKVEQTFIKADLGRLKQILNNLVGNAIKFTSKGEIIISAELYAIDQHHAKIFFSIKDTGIGIPKDKIHSLFDAFTQADTSTTRKYGGTGLGLSIAKNLVEIMGGELTVISELGEGSSFNFTIHVELDNNLSLVLPHSDVKGKSILIVDDNSVNRGVLAKQLEHWGMNVNKAASAQEALDISTQKIKDKKTIPFDIALLDMHMPDMNGEALGKALHKLPKCKDMKMVLMTSYGMHENLENLLKIGFNAFFTKPTTTSDLFNTLNLLNDNPKNSNVNQTLSTKEDVNPLGDNTIESFRLPENSKILLVEDNVTNQLVAQGILESMSQSADIANNGQEALELLNNDIKNYDIILMDCQMPIMDGFETTINIRNSKAGKHNTHIPIIAMTANAMDGDKEKCIKSGMDDYISKPIDPYQLKKVLSKWLKQ